MPLPKRLTTKRAYTMRQLYVRAVIYGVVLLLLTKYALGVSWGFAAAVCVVYAVVNVLVIRWLRRRGRAASS